jgi:hypothetical protein
MPVTQSKILKILRVQLYQQLTLDNFSNIYENEGSLDKI